MQGDQPPAQQGAGGHSGLLDHQGDGYDGRGDRCLFTFALGTAAGNLATEALNLGFQVGVLVFAGLIAAIAGAYWLGGNAVLTFWLAYILTRPLGASLGDLLSQSWPNGGLGLGTVQTSIAFLLVITALVAAVSIGPNGRGRLPKAPGQA